MSAEIKAPYKAPYVEVNCPVCDGRHSKVLRESTYPADISIQDLQSVYCASSDHVLMDRVVECSCGMIYISPRLDAGLIQGGYEAVEDPVFVAQNPQRIRTFARVARSILTRIGLNPAGKQLLDIGCAGGAFLVAARDAGFQVKGIEPSRWLSGYARQQYGLDVRQGILEPGVFPDGSFDVVSLWDVIEHVPEPRAVLSNVHALLKRDGYLWVNYPDAGSVAAKVLSWRWPFWLSVHLHYYVRDSMRCQLEKAGFEVSYMHPHWQQLQFGYVLQRVSALVPPMRLMETLVSAVKLDSLPFTYNMGQTLVVARRKNK